MGAREAMEEIETYVVSQAFWTPLELGVPADEDVRFIASALVAAERPLVIVGSTGRYYSSVKAMVHLANTIKGLRVLDTAGSDMCFPANYPAWLGLRYGEHEYITKADFILVVECDVSEHFDYSKGCVFRECSSTALAALKRSLGDTAIEPVSTALRGSYFR